MNCNECGFWKSDMDPQTGAEIHRCACNASPQLDDETAAEDGCEYGVPPIEDVLRWLDHRLQGALMPGAERMYRAIRYYLGEATALSTFQAENEKLRETVDKYATAARVIALHLKPFCDESLPYDEMIADAARKASDELEQVTLENNALWTYIEIVDREYRRYMDRGYIDRLDELKKVWKRGQKEDGHGTALQNDTLCV